MCADFSNTEERAAAAPTAAAFGEDSPRARSNKTFAMPVDVSSNVVRSNAVRLLQSALSSLPAAVRCESAIEKLYGEERTKYFECVSRCAAQLQVCMLASHQYGCN